MAALFRSVAEGETGHAFGHFDFLAEVGDPVTDVPVGATEDNLNRPSRARPTSTPRCTPASPGPPATRASTRSPSGSRPWPGPRRATPAASPQGLENICLSLRPIGPRRPRAAAARPRRPGRPMTTTYDPFHPQYFDEADLRAGDEPGLRPVPRLPAVLQVLHGVPDAVRRRSTAHDDQDAARLTAAEQDQVVDECFHCKLCYVNCPYMPGPARVGARLPPADAAGRAGAAPRPAAAALPTRLTDQVARPHRPARQGRHRARPGRQPGDRARPARLGRKVHGEGRRHRQPSGCCRRTPASGSRPGCKQRARPLRFGRERAGRASLLFPTCLVEYQAPQVGQDLVRVYERNGIECDAARRARCAAARRGCTRGDVDNFREQAEKNVKVLADAVRAPRPRRRADVVVPQPTCSYVLKHDYPDYLGGEPTPSWWPRTPTTPPST